MSLSRARLLAAVASPPVLVVPAQAAATGVAKVTGTSTVRCTAAAEAVA
ncbi:hypothetical protein ACTOB_008562 [Actinoplanes oblitus]|uniref:Uncharacterized protein n=1 Tax=Actinoplanes oblitus TaxID=3040509 RepID=A0ABY8WEY4_9ACTN|nr:hypothetical protein [Actinoplanes oblitus]WIM96370.1 hypothetical protein ACTOB_008562 [Actinoplanes oblitus]